MATSSKTRRKTPAPTVDSANIVATAAAPATAPARKAPARKRAAAAAPAAAPVVAEAPAAPAPQPAAKKKPAAKKAAKAAAKQATKPAPVAAEPVAEAAPAVTPPKPAAKKAAAKKAAASKTDPGKAGTKPAAAKKSPTKKAAARKATPKPAAQVVVPEAEATVVADDTPVINAAPVAEPAPTVDTASPVIAEAQAEAPAQADAAEPAEDSTDAPADAPASTDRPERSRRSRNRRRKAAAAVDPQAQATTEAVLAVLAAPADDAGDATTNAADTSAPLPEAPPEPEPPAPPTGPAHSQIVVLPGDAVRIAWQPGHACPPALKQAAQRRCDDDGLLSPEDDGALPQLLRLAQEGGHTLLVDDAVWAALAAHRDARHRLGALESAYPDGPASSGLQRLLRVPLPLFQAEGALFAVVAGRALIADERGLGKTVQAIAAAQLWRRHFGVQRVLVLCAPAQRAAWQRAWRRLAGHGDDDVQLVDGSHHQRAAQWSTAAGVRIAAPEALQTDAAHLAHWAPDLVIVDEPQQLGLHAADWAALAAAPQALVLSGAPLADLPELMDSLVAWLDVARLGPLAALRELQAASRGERQLGEDDVERLSNALSRLMLQRQRDDVADQLPPVVHSERLLPLAPGQRAAHDGPAAVARRLLAGWQASGWCSDSDQWRLAQALRAMQDACHRADPTDPASPLAEATVQALAATLDDLAGTGAPRAAVLCASAADRDQLAQRLADHGSAAGVPLLVPGEHLPGGIDVVLQAGVPWRPRRQPGGPRGEAPAGQQWLYLVAQDGIDTGLFDTLAARLDLPRSPADGNGGGGGSARGWLQGEALQQWLTALQLALAATPTAAG